MPQTLTSVHGVKNQTKHKSAYCNVQMSKLTRNAMILFIQCYRRSWRMTFVQSNGFLHHASSPGLNLQKHLCQMWAGSLIHNKNYSTRLSRSRQWLGGIWECEDISVSTGHKPCQLTHISRRIMTKVSLGVTDDTSTVGVLMGVRDVGTSQLNTPQCSTQGISQYPRCPNQWQNHETV